MDALFDAGLDWDSAEAWIEYRQHGEFDPKTGLGVGPLGIKELRAYGAPLK